MSLVCLRISAVRVHRVGEDHLLVLALAEAVQNARLDGRSAHHCLRDDDCPSDARLNEVAALRKHLRRRFAVAGPFRTESTRAVNGAAAAVARRDRGTFFLQRRERGGA